MNKEDIFNSLVTNAFDFLEKAILEIDEYPKFSMINFYASLELFLKARLLHEHWTLIISRRKEPDIEKFLSGDFQSITISDAESLLKKVLNSGLSKDVSKIFKEVGNHRNKIVHFYNNDIENNSEKWKIVKLQLVAWYHLNQLLKVNWLEVFIDYQSQINKIEQMLKKYHDFLLAIFNGLNDIIESKIENGSTFHNCPSCGFKSQEHTNSSDENPHTAICLVCNLHENFFILDCPHCNKEITISESKKDSCPLCSNEITQSDILDDIETIGDPYAGEASYANCETCGGHQTVGVLNSGKYFCSCCLEKFDNVQICEYCSEYNTGNMENSYLFGCSMCEGMQGQLI